MPKTGPGPKKTYGSALYASAESLLYLYSLVQSLQYSLVMKKWLSFIISIYFTVNSWAIPAQNLTCSETIAGSDASALLALGGLSYNSQSQFVALSPWLKKFVSPQETILPTYEPFLITEVGKRRMEWLLNHSLVDASSAQKRQQLVRLLAEDPKALEAVDHVLKQIKTTYQEKDLERLLTPDRESSLSGVGYNTVLGLDATLLSAIYVLGGNTEPVIAPLIVLTLHFLGTTIASERLMHVRGSMKSLNKIYNKLGEFFVKNKNCSKEGVQEFCRIGYKLMNGDHPNSAQEALDYLKKVRSFPQSVFADYSWFSLLSLGKVSNSLRENSNSLALLFGMIAELDVLAALAKHHIKNSDEYVFPEILEQDTLKFEFVNGHNPYLLNSSSFSNSISLDLTSDPKQFSRNSGITAILTGRNKRGKSTALQTSITFSIIGSIGGSVPAKSFRFTPFQPILYIQPSDSLVDSESTHSAEAKRMVLIEKEIRNSERYILFSDELARGTSSYEALGAQVGFLLKISRQKKGAGLFATHNRQLVEFSDHIPGAFNIHVSDSNDQQRIYKIEFGSSTAFNSAETLKEAGVSEEVVNAAINVRNHLLKNNGRLKIDELDIKSLSTAPHDKP